MALEFSICEVRWERYRRVAENPHAREWLKFQAARGLAANTIEAYGRDLDCCLGFLDTGNIPFDSVIRPTIGAYIQSIAELAAPRVRTKGASDVEDRREWKTRRKGKNRTHVGEKAVRFRTGSWTLIGTDCASDAESADGNTFLRLATRRFLGGRIWGAQERGLLLPKRAAALWEGTQWCRGRNRESRRREAAGRRN